MVGSNTFTKTICSICYEDLKPIVEDLQSISICGHVFHELCLQQWFEYCTNGKKRNCPVCKQTCSPKNVGRLYFQSIGDPNDHNLSQKPLDDEQTPCELRNEVKKLEGKVLGLTSALDQRNKDFEEVKYELNTCKQNFEVEKKLKNEALKEKSTIKQLLNSKSEELDKSTLECKRLQEKNMALFKELAAIKLVSDLNLDEDEVLKFASIGKETNSKETIDILKKSLVIRNKSYKELMVKCNKLGRGESSRLSELEKAKEKIRKMKVRIHELESSIEGKENEALRNLKASKNTNFQKEPKKEEQVNVLHKKLAPCVSEGKMKLPKATNHKSTTPEVMIDNTIDQNIEDKVVILLDDDEDMRKTSDFVNEIPDRYVKPTIKSENDLSNTVNAKNDISPAFDDVTMPDQPLFSIRKETSSTVSITQPGYSCFSGGLRGPDGTNWHLGKWCKKGDNNNNNNKGSTSSSINSGNLIAVGADGRGGRMKVLRSLNSSTSDDKDCSTFAKRCKYGGDKGGSGLQSQINHFFGKTG